MTAFQHTAVRLQVRTPARKQLPRSACSGAGLLWLLLLVWFWGWGTAPGSRAHSTSDSYLELRQAAGEIQGQWDLPLRDLELALGLDANGDHAITWSEVQPRQTEISAYALRHLRLEAGAANLALEPTEFLVDSRDSAGYAVIRFRVNPPPEGGLVTVHYDLFFEVDRLHRGLASYVHPNGEAVSWVFSPGRARMDIGVAHAGRLAAALSYCAEGVHHIWIGLDHILFLGALLLPAVFRAPAAGAPQPVASLREAMGSVFKVVTAFTVAHSITLSVAALGWMEFPPRLVEIAIALSVAIAAANNLLGWMPARGWLVAFSFGLVHGFGFAAVLGEIGLHAGAAVVSLAAFNLGVELGQIAIAAVFLPLAYAARHSQLYRCGALQGGSVVIVAAGLAWTVERVLAGS